MAVKRLVYVRCPVCGSLRRWSKGGFCSEVKPFEFVVDEVEIKGKGRGQGWSTKHDWKTVPVQENPAYLLMLDNLLSRLQKAQQLLQDRIHEVKMALIRSRDGRILEEDVKEIDDRIKPDTSSVLGCRLFLAELNWRENSWLVGKSRLRSPTPVVCSSGLTKMVTPVSGMSVSKLSLTRNSVVFRSSSSVVGPAQKK